MFQNILNEIQQQTATITIPITILSMEKLAFTSRIGTYPHEEKVLQYI